MSILGGLFDYHPRGRYGTIVPPLGRKVVFLNKNGSELHRKNANAYFQEGDILTVHEIYVDRSSSEVEFVEHIGIKFNTVMFRDVIEEQIFGSGHPYN